jgi:phosphatidate cytidylyltransferase
MLTQRLITAAVGIPLIIVVTLLGGPVYTIVAAAILGLAALECFTLLASAQDPTSASASLWQPRLPAVAAVGGVILITVAADSGFDEWTGAAVEGIGLAFLLVLALGEPRDGLRDWTAIVATLAYVGILGSYIVLLRDLDDGGDWILMAVLATWGTDTLAYATGKLIGRHKMAPRISPGKTWEGTAGAFVGGFATVVFINWPLALPMSFSEAALLGLLLPPVAVAADLGESLLKRGAGVKDTSELVPGHGGFLDRLDSILFTVPLVYYFAIWVVL